MSRAEGTTPGSDVPKAEVILSGLIDSQFGLPGLRPAKIEALRHFPALLTSAEPISPHLTLQADLDDWIDDSMPPDEVERIQTRVIFQRGTRLGQSLAMIKFERERLPFDKENYVGWGDSRSWYEETRKMMDVHITITDEQIAQLAAKAHREGNPALSIAIISGYAGAHMMEYRERRRGSDFDDYLNPEALAKEKRRHVETLYRIFVGEEGEGDVRGDGGTPPPPDGGDREPRNPTPFAPSRAQSLDEPAATEPAEEQKERVLISGK